MHLSPELTFVVQMDSETSPTKAGLVGRAEHVTSGASYRFTATQELIEFLEQQVIERRVGTRAPPGRQSNDKRSG